MFHGMFWAYFEGIAVLVTQRFCNQNCFEYFAKFVEKHMAKVTF